MVARYGGEEFAVVFAAIGAAAASRIVGEAREAVANRHFKVRETDAPLGAVTFSAGVVAAGKEEDVESAMKRADALLYKAKDRGRNRVEVDTARGPRPSPPPQGEAVNA
jgi:diguanylate cyclase